MSLFDRGISRITGVGDELMRPSDSVTAMASVSCDWVIVFFLFLLTPRIPEQHGLAKVPNDALSNKARVRQNLGFALNRGERESAMTLTSPLTNLDRYIPATPCTGEECSTQDHSPTSG
jgi:hypothetical protein